MRCRDKSRPFRWEAQGDEYQGWWELAVAGTATSARHACLGACCCKRDSCCTWREWHGRRICVGICVVGVTVTCGHLPVCLALQVMTLVGQRVSVSKETLHCWDNLKDQSPRLAESESASVSQLRWSCTLWFEGRSFDRSWWQWPCSGPSWSGNEWVNHKASKRIKNSYVVLDLGWYVRRNVGCGLDHCANLGHRDHIRLRHRSSLSLDRGNLIGDCGSLSHQLGLGLWKF